MSTWKKVALSEDIGIFAGGTNTDVLGGTENDLITVGADGDFQYTAVPDGGVVFSEGGTLAGYTFLADQEVTVSVDTDNNTLAFNVASNAITSSELAANQVFISHLAHAGFDDILDADVTGGILYWNDSDNPVILEAGNDGEVLAISSGVPAWTSAGTATLVTINNGAALSGNLGIIFGSESSSAPGDEDKAYVDGTFDSYNLSYNPGISGATQPEFSSGAYSENPVGTAASAGLYSKHGFSGDLVGTASAAKAIETTATANPGTYYAPMLQASAAQSHGAQVFTNSGIVYTANSDGDVDVTINGNLTVNGSATKVEIEAAEVQIADFRLLLAHTDADGSADGDGNVNLNSDAIQTAANNLGVGILVDNAGQTTERNLGRLSYFGHKLGAQYQNSNTVLGWEMAQEIDNTASNAATKVGVAAMHVNPQSSGYMTTGGSTDDHNFGVGAMGWFGDENGLWIQTAV